MGYRYGERRYGQGLYSAWPDQWRLLACRNDQWAPAAPASPANSLASPFLAEALGAPPPKPPSPSAARFQRIAR